MIDSERREAISELAQILGISEDLIREALEKLKTKEGYLVWSRPKKSGGEREIQAAQPPLNEIQARIAVGIYPHSISKINHSFVARRSHRTAILPHLWANTFFSFDIKNAFPSVKKKWVQSSFQMIDLKASVAELMADLVCYSPTEKPEEEFLPQGHVSSPYVFNLVLKNIDQVLAGFAQKRGYQVTRYVDNFAISTREELIPEKERRLAIEIVERLSLGSFKIPEEKTSYSEAKKGRVHFEFLGLVIEEKNGERKVGVADEKLAEYEWTIHKAMMGSDFSQRKFREIKGKITYLKSVYQDRPLPSQVADLYTQYRLMREMANAVRKGQLFLSI